MAQAGHETDPLLDALQTAAAKAPTRRSEGKHCGYCGNDLLRANGQHWPDCPQPKLYAASRQYAEMAALLERYRQKEKERHEFLLEVRECPFCGSYPTHHQEECALGPVEPCGKTVTDSTDEDEGWTCTMIQGHEGECE